MFRRKTQNLRKLIYRALFKDKSDLSVVKSLLFYYLYIAFAEKYYSMCTKRAKSILWIDCIAAGSLYVYNI